MINSVAKRFETDYPEEFRCLYMKECSESGRNALKEKRVITSYLAGKIMVRLFYRRMKELLFF